MSMFYEDRALIIVDYQNDFVKGSLPVKGAEQILTPMVAMLEEHKWGQVVATQDWHPANHSSFLKNEERVSSKSKWPPHCVAGTNGAELFCGDLWQKYVNIVIRKGYRQYYEAYSAFNDSGDDRRGGLAEILKHKGIRDVYICGLAYDICVAHTAFDSAFHHFRTFVIENLCRAVSDKAVMFPTDRIKVITLGGIEKL